MQRGTITGRTYEGGKERQKYKEYAKGRDKEAIEYLCEITKRLTPD